MTDEQHPGARHAATLHGDVVGYSKLIADNEIETYNTLQVLRGIIEDALEAHGGTLASFVGDEFLAILDSEGDSVLAAIEIQRSIAHQNDGLPAGRKMRFRLGIHAGDVSSVDDRWYGDAINIAARLQALAEPGGINVSRQVLDAAGDLPVRIESLGPTRLKNIPEQVTIYRIINQEADQDGSKPWQRRVVPPSAPSLAISPFMNYGAEEDSHFADGLMMALAISLTRIPGVDVISGLATLAYRDQSFSSQQLGHELGVRYVLEGAVQRVGDKVRVHTQLIDATDGKIAWADRFEASFADVFAAQDDIEQAIASALDAEVLGREAARLYRSDIASESVEIVYKGLQHLSKGSPEELLQATECFEEVAAREPESATGFSLASLAHVWLAMFAYTDDIEGHYKLADQHARKAKELGDPSGISNTVLAHMSVMHQDWDGALKAVKSAVGMRPSCDLTYGIAASVMRYLGNWEEAIGYADRATRLSPLFAPWYRSIRADAEFIGEQYESAADGAESLVAQNEQDLNALLTLAAAQSALGRRRHASAAIEQARLTQPGLDSDGLRSLPYRDEADLDRFISALQDAGLD